MTPDEYAHREPFGGRYYEFWNVEGDGEPIMIFFRKEDADKPLALNEIYQVQDGDI